MQSDPARYGDDGRFDPATVIGLQSHHRVLVIGNAAFLPWLTRENENVVSARRSAEIVRELDEGHDFDRVIVGREVEIEHHELLLQAEIALVQRHGLLIYFPSSEGDAWSFKERVEFFNPGSHVWDNDSSFGRIIQVRLSGGWNV
jgi:hypothetical protein